jgi:carbonic anhydrase
LVGWIAQSVEQRTENPCVAGSIPAPATNFFSSAGESEFSPQTQPTMQKLIDGVHKFRDAEFGRYRTLFKRLSRQGQNPHTLFITCSDSRVLAELITQSQPGDLFVVKNIGNIVPPSNVVGSTNSTAAAIEFAVQSLDVSDIVVCGHSQCGAMTALLDQKPRPNSPHLNQWLEIAAPVRTLIENNYSSLKKNSEEQITAAGEENVLFAVENLRTYPGVAQKLENGSLRLHAWFFKISSAELFAYDPEAKQFERLVGDPHKP